MNERRRGFILLEVMLAVAIFSIGVIALGMCVDNCIKAEITRADDQKARLALENRVGELRAGALEVGAGGEEELTGMFTGITLGQTRTALELKNEKNEPVRGLFTTTVTARWTSEGEPQSKSVTFYELDQQR